MKIKDIINNSIKVGDIIYPTSNYYCRTFDNPMPAYISFYNKEINLNSMNAEYNTTIDSFLQGIDHPGYMVTTTPARAIWNDEIVYVSLLKSKYSNATYICALNYVIKKDHEFGKVGNYIRCTDNSYITRLSNPVKENVFLLEPEPEYKDPDDEPYENNNPLKIIKEPYDKEIRFENNVYMKKFVNVESEITVRQYSILYNKGAEIF